MLKKLQKKLKDYKINYYIIPTDDDHQSEIVGDYYQVRSYISGFDGSAGTLIVTQDNAYLWTDGRYFIQAAHQLKEGIELMKMGQKGVPTIQQFLKDHIQDGDVIGFDGETMMCKFIIDLEESLECDYKIYSKDMMDDLWKDRPQRSAEKAYMYDLKYCGMSAKEKIRVIQEYMKENDCESHIITTLDDIAWTFNIRGQDTHESPVVLAFALITLDKAYLYLQDRTYDFKLANEYKKENIFIKDYFDIYKDVTKLKGRTLINSSSLNYTLFNQISSELVDGIYPSTAFKAVKNDTELACTRNAHIKDGVAMTKAMYWLKKNHGVIEMDELMISNKIRELRAQQDLFVFPSFTSIVAWKDNAALMHYHPTDTDYSKIEGNGLLLIDSGGQYLDGTTDITRTYALGEISEIEKTHFTLVFQGMMALQKAHFLKGATGLSVDILARMPMWEVDLDYQCGTGHGVGHFLNVHEGPHGIRPRARSLNEYTVLEEGMIVTDEPGIYLENQYGIRLENELIVRNGTENEYGQFMYFECITFAPIDLDAIDISMLSPKEKKWLNDYHKEVYDKVSPYLDSDEQEWLKHYTREI